MAKESINFKNYPNAKGITGYIEGTKLVLEIDLTGDFGLSKSEKTKVIATTGGSVKLPGNILLGLNVNRKVEKA
jgi:hypothetical protein